MAKKFVFLGFVVLAIGLLASLPKALADSNNWIGSPTFNLDKIRDLDSGELPPYSINGNRDCINQKIITRPGRLVPPQSEQSHESCVVDTNYGAYSTSGYLQRQGTALAGQVRSPGGSFYNIIPIPRSNTSLRLGSPGANGVNLFFTNGYGNVLRSTADFTGAVSHTAAPDYTSALKDRSGQLFYTQPNSISFSANSRWMIVDSAFIGTARVNLDTFEVLPFGPAYNYNIGLTPSIQSAISGDGRYAVLFSKSFSRFRLYDLSTCGAVPNYIVGPVSCQFRDLLPYFQSQLLGFTAVSTIRFINNESISLYGTRQDGGSAKTAQYVLRLPGASTFSMDYLALGDSYTSGEGAYSYKALTDTKDNKCHLSQVSYPYLLGRDLALNKYESVACSGATIFDVSNKLGDYNTKFRQAKGKEDGGYDNEILENFLPGYRLQSRFLENHKPGTITISAVGNDIGFSSKLRRCLLWPDTCFSTYEDRLEIVREINNQFSRLIDMYQQIKSASDPRTKIYAIGYPQIAKPGGNCAINVLLNNDELQFSEDLIGYLNSVVKQAAAKIGVAYVDIENALVGHRLCEPDSSWDVAVNGLTAGNDVIKQLGGPFGLESYHPTAFGQWLVEQKVLSQSVNFTQSMPNPDSSAKPPVESDSIALLQAPKDGRQIQKVNYDSDLSNDVLYRNGLWDIVMNGVSFGLKPLSVFKAVLNSTPVTLGSHRTDASGNLSFRVTLPANAPTGWHTLHLYGQNVADEPIDIYKVVYIAASQNDFNGDGVLNSNDPCPASESSVIDADSDGIDDACDGFIDKALASPSTAETITPLSDIIQPTQPLVVLPEALSPSVGAPASPATILNTPVDIIVPDTTQIIPLNMGVVVNNPQSLAMSTASEITVRGTPFLNPMATNNEAGLQPTVEPPQVAGIRTDEGTTAVASAVPRINKYFWLFGPVVVFLLIISARFWRHREMA